jgi:hypothetical protein
MTTPQGGYGAHMCHRRQPKAGLLPRHIRQPKIHQKGAVLSQPLAQLFTREDPDTSVGDVLTAVPPPPIGRLDGRGPARHRHLPGHWHHHGARRPPLPGVTTSRRHGRSPTDPPEPQGPTNMLGEAVHSSRSSTRERRLSPPTPWSVASRQDPATPRCRFYTGPCTPPSKGEPSPGERDPAVAIPTWALPDGAARRRQEGGGVLGILPTARFRVSPVSPLGGTRVRGGAGEH